jgi:hypothetical protein
MSSSIDVGLREYPKNRPGWTNPNPNSKPLPGLGILAPNLRQLIVTDLALSFERIDDLVSTLGPGFKILEFVVVVLSPQLFDLLASKVPSLQMLAVEYKAISDVNHNTENRNASVSQPRSTYRLRISFMSSCGLPIQVFR